MARASRVVQSPGVHQCIALHIPICNYESIYDGIAVASPGGHLMTGAVATADVLPQHRRPQAPRVVFEVLQAQRDRSKL
eukprot:3412983-Pyramimonas_sp.AAC.1